jgi:hypothetical protein
MSNQPTYTEKVILVAIKAKPWLLSLFALASLCTLVTSFSGISEMLQSALFVPGITALMLASVEFIMGRLYYEFALVAHIKVMKALLAVYLLIMIFMIVTSSSFNVLALGGEEAIGEHLAQNIQKCNKVADQTLQQLKKEQTIGQQLVVTNEHFRGLSQSEEVGGGPTGYKLPPVIL